MSQPSIFNHRGKIMMIALIMLALACNMPGSGTPAAGAPQPTAFDPTKAALEFQATAMSQKMTEQALAAESENPATQAPQQPTSAPPTEIIPASTEIVPTATQDIEARMKSAKILVYEDTPYIGLWIKDTLHGMGLKHVFVGDAMGDFMENLNSGIQWDLIILGAESHDYVSGDFFDVITERVVNDKTALIVEMWYLDKISEGRIKPLTTKCGVKLQKSYDVASSIYWLESGSPFFTEPNIAIPLIHYDIYWAFQAGDYLRLLPGSEATLLAGMYQNRDSDYGVIASCFEGRVILQTFCNHDYHESDIQLLWENYIYNTLKNRFIALDQ
ncbi:MAG: hypothetical protein JW730_21410 [Anaerolineales bacterium]|nr:hypothetical protein [Anaerolineales bacterium]